MAKVRYKWVGVQPKHAFFRTTQSTLTLEEQLAPSNSPLAVMSVFAPPPAPSTNLGYHRQLSPLYGVHVSPICLGAMSIGDKWNDSGMGATGVNKKDSFKLLNAFYEAGGNFIDTANN